MPKFSEFTNQASPADTDQVVGLRSTTNSRFTLAAIKALFNSVANTAGKAPQRDTDGSVDVGAVNLDTAATPTGQEGQIRWNATDKCAEVVQDGGVVVQVGQELTVRARNVTGTTLPNGTPVYVSGATGNRPTVARADADAKATSATLIGLVTDSAGIANNADGHVTVYGMVRDLDTSSFAEGAALYLSDGASGTLTATKPTAAGSFVVRVGFVTRSHATQGVILVEPAYFGSTLGEQISEAATPAAVRTIIDAQQADSDLTALAAVSTNGLLARTGDGTAAARTITAPAAGITVSNGGGVSGNPTLALANDLAALEGLSSTGLAVRTGTDTWTQRTITGTAPITITNGDGVSGNPTVAIGTASDTAVGVVELATSAEAITGTDTTRAVTPAGDRAALTAYVDPIALTRTPSSYFQSDGATAGRGIVYTGGARQAIAGVPVVQMAFEMLVPTTGPSSAQIITSQSNATSDPTTSLANCLSIRLATDSLVVRANGSTTGDNRSFFSNTFRTTYSGQRIRGLITLTQGTTNPVVEINGVNVSSNFTASAAGTPPQWLDASLSSAFQMAGFNWPAGEMPLVTPILGQLSAGESATWFSTGRLPAWVHAGGSAVTQNTSTFTNTAGASGFETFTGASATGFAGIGTDEYSQAQVPLPAYITGQRARIIYDLVINSGQAPRAVFNGQANGAQILAAGVSQNVVVTADASRTSGMAFYVTAASDFVLSNVRIYQEGALTLPGPQGIATARDLTAIGGNQGRLVGVTPCLTDSIPVLTVERPAEAYTTATSVQLLGGAITGGRKRRVVSISGNSSASVNISVGTSSGGTQIVNAQAVNGDFDLSTFASRILAANTSLWVTFSGNTTASLVIQLSDL